MPAPSRIEAFAIISADGMIADAAGHMPDALKIEADQQFFHAGLDRAAVVVHGRRSHEGGPNAARRRRLIVTSRVPRLAPAPAYPHALVWNPIGASLAEAWSGFGSPAGTLAVVGGADVYALFWGVGYDAFHLTRVAQARLPGGRPVFRGLSTIHSPEDVLAEPWAASRPDADARSGGRSDARDLAALIICGRAAAAASGQPMRADFARSFPRGPLRSPCTDRTCNSRSPSRHRARPYSRTMARSGPNRLLLQSRISAPPRR